LFGGAMVSVELWWLNSACWWRNSVRMQIGNFYANRIRRPNHCQPCIGAISVSGLVI